MTWLTARLALIGAAAIALAEQLDKLADAVQGVRRG